MTQIGDFFARIISAGGSRGLSGDAELVLAPDPALAFFNERLRRHTTSDDLVAEPERLWDSSGFLSGRGGLRSHVLAERGNGVLGLTDILVVVNQDDWRRSFREVRRPWVDRVQGLLRDRFDRFAEEEDIHTLYPQREVGFTVVEDGGEELRGHSLGLERGQFVTGLLPNLYGGAVGASRPVVAIHLNLPGEWEGYREVGRLWSDQVLFTVGTHWLDNASHPALREPALYRLYRYGDGSFVHVVNPEVRDRYHISNQLTPGGASVLSLEDANGEAVAYIVVAVLDHDRQTPRKPTADAPARPITLSTVPTADRSPPMLLAGSKTVVPLELDERILTLRESGALLQKVHFARFMEGYDVFIGRSGEVATALPRPAASLHVRGRQVSIEAHLPGVRLDHAPLVVDAPEFITGERVISVGGHELRYRDLSGVQEDGWPYLGEIRRIGSTAHMVFGSRYLVGRDPRCKVRLPDEPHNDNIVWRPELRSGGSIRSRNGEIPKSRFYIDSIMVASEHAEVDLTDEPRLLSRARHCYTYVRRDGAIYPLYPAKDGGGPMEMGLRPGDELLVGNCVFEVALTDPDTRPPASLAPEPLSAEVLAQAMDDDELADPGAADPFDVPAAAGLGEAGRRPEALSLSGAGLDSFTMEDAPSVGALDPRVAAPMLPEPPRASAPMLPEEPPIAAPMLPEEPPIAAPMLDVSISDFVSGGDEVSAEIMPEDAPTRRGPRAPSASSGPASMSDGLETPLADAFDRAGPEAPPPAPQVPAARPRPPVSDATDDPTAVPVRPPPPVAILPSGDSILGNDLVPDPPAGLLPPSGAARSAAGAVAVVDEADWQLELSRPGRLVLIGWMVSGRQTLGNHAQADIVLPENRSSPEQRFGPMDYAEVFARGRRASLDRLAPTEVRLLQGDGEVAKITDPHRARIEVLRRDPDGEEDFAIGLTLETDGALPDPRARLLRIDRSDRMAAALFTLGVPLRQTRAIDLAGVSCRVRFDGNNLQLAGYLSDYRRADGGFRPFFMGGPEGGFQTLPEDGTPVTLDPGDRLISGSAVYVFERQGG